MAESIGTESGREKRQGRGDRNREGEWRCSEAIPKHISMTRRAWEKRTFLPAHERGYFPWRSFHKAISPAGSTFGEGQNKTTKGLPRSVGKGLTGVEIRVAFGRGVIEDPVFFPRTYPSPLPPSSRDEHIAFAFPKLVRLLSFSPPLRFPKKPPHVIMTKDCKGESGSSFAERSP